MKQTTLYAIIIIIVFTLALTFTYKDGALFIQKNNVVNVKIKMKELIADLENIIDHANIGQNIILQKKLVEFKKKLINNIEVTYKDVKH